MSFSGSYALSTKCWLDTEGDLERHMDWSLQDFATSTGSLQVINIDLLIITGWDDIRVSRYLKVHCCLPFVIDDNFSRILVECFQ